MSHRAVIGLGSNLGKREFYIRLANRLVEWEVGRVVQRSSVIETPAWGFESDPFLNQVIVVETELSPRSLLNVTQDIERVLGRTRKSVGGHYSDRPIDIDILLYDNLRVDEPDLKIPHPLMHERDFVMRPLQEILPANWPIKFR